MKFDAQSKGVKSFTEQSKSRVNLSPGQYNPGQAFDKFQSDYQKACIKMMPESKYTSVRFTDIVVKNKSFVQPPGQYSNLDKA
jgi:hypothetical protein